VTPHSRGRGAVLIGQFGFRIRTRETPSEWGVQSRRGQVCGVIRAGFGGALETSLDLWRSIDSGNAKNWGQWSEANIATGRNVIA
jgi:hypothetical protein